MLSVCARFVVARRGQVQGLQVVAASGVEVLQQYWLGITGHEAVVKASNGDPAEGAEALSSS